MPPAPAVTPVAEAAAIGGYRRTWNWSLSDWIGV